MLVVHFVVFLVLAGLAATGFKVTVPSTSTYGDGTTNITYRWKRGIFGVLAIAYALLIPPAFGQVEAGHRGVILRFGSPQDTVLGEGLYILPPIGHSVVSVNVQSLVYAAKSEEAASHDLQTVHTDVVLNYRLDPSRVVEIYRLYRQDIETRVLAPATREVIKAATSRYTAEQLIQQRPQVKDVIDGLLEERMGPVGLLLEATNITNFAFSDDFSTTIEQQAVAQRQVEVEKNKLLQVQQQAQQQVIQAEAAAKARIEQARGEAESTRLRAIADAESIRLRGDALTANPGLVAMEIAQRWDGKYPPYYFAGGGTIPIVNLPAVAAAATGGR